MTDDYVSENTGYIMEITRRNFFKVVPAVVGMAIGVPVLDGFFIEPKFLQVSRPEIPIDGLPEAFDGFRIALLTDIHHSAVVSRDYIEKAVRAANEHKPDLVVLGGDFVTRNAKFIGPVFEALAGLEARHGVVAVLGNHDHWTDAEETRRRIQRIGALELRNSSAEINVGGSRLCVAGVGDLWEDTQNLEAAFDGVDEHVPRIVVSHNPDFAEEMGGSHRVDLMLCGHTHGGQYVMPLLGAPIVPSKYGNKYRAGLVRGPHCRVYVSRGVGLISPPVRFLCRPELPVITLRKS